MKKYISSFLIFFFVFVVEVGFAQSNAKEDFVFSFTNQPGKNYPQVNSEGRVRASLSAPNAHKVQLDIGGVRYGMIKDENGIWTGDSNPQDEGFHYYQLWVDGVAVPDPGTKYYYGAGRWGSGIEIPAFDRDFYALKNVPHGALHENIYFSEITNSFRRCFVYTPPGYDKNLETKYPVLYLQHGSFEDESGWSSQGKANLILDNLIADKKAIPMIVVMENGYAFEPNVKSENGGRPKFVFEDVMVQEVIPMIDKTYRTITDRDYRGMAGLSMGANQTIRLTMNNLDLFSYIGGFSGTSNYPRRDKIDRKIFMEGAFKDGQILNEKIKLFWLSIGTKEPEPFPESIEAFCNMLEEAGIEYGFYESPETAHEWLTWRRSLYQFAQNLFKN